MKPPKYADNVLYLDFDGVLHDSEVYFSPKQGIHIRTLGCTLFEWMPLLEEILNSFPEVAIVLSTSWVRARSFNFAKRQLSTALQQRVIGATYHRREMNKYFFMGTPRWLQIVDDVKRRQPKNWIALDDDVYDWPDKLLNHLVATDGATGLTCVTVKENLVKKLHGFTA